MINDNTKAICITNLYNICKDKSDYCSRNNKNNVLSICLQNKAKMSLITSANSHEITNSHHHLFNLRVFIMQIIAMSFTLVPVRPLNKDESIFFKAV